MIIYSRNIAEESLKVFETNGRLIDKAKKSEFKKKLIKELERQEQQNTLLLQNKMDRVKLADQMKVREEKIEKLKKENPNSELIPILMEQMKSEREANNQRMEMMWKSMEQQMAMTRETMQNMGGGGGGFCNIQ